MAIRLECCNITVTEPAQDDLGPLREAAPRRHSPIPHTQGGPRSNPTPLAPSAPIGRGFFESGSRLPPSGRHNGALVRLPTMRWRGVSGGKAARCSRVPVLRLRISIRRSRGQQGGLAIQRRLRGDSRARLQCVASGFVACRHRIGPWSNSHALRSWLETRAVIYCGVQRIRGSQPGGLSGHRGGPVLRTDRAGLFLAAVCVRRRAMRERTREPTAACLSKLAIARRRDRGRVVP